MQAYDALKQVRDLLDHAMDILDSTGDIESMTLDTLYAKIRNASEFITLSDELRRDL